MIKALLRKYKISKILNQPLVLTGNERDVVDYIESCLKGIKPFTIGKSSTVYYINKNGKFIFAIRYERKKYYQKGIHIRNENLWQNLAFQYNFDNEEMIELFKFFIEKSLNKKFDLDYFCDRDACQYIVETEYRLRRTYLLRQFIKNIKACKKYFNIWFYVDTLFDLKERNSYQNISLKTLIIITRIFKIKETFN